MEPSAPGARRVDRTPRSEVKVQSRVPTARVEIPAIGVDAEVVTLRLEADGSLEEPTDFSDVGWWSGGPWPGEVGPAVLTGHVDSRRTGPGVFYRLRDLGRGDEIRVARGGKKPFHFLVDRTEQHPKDHFPTARVYGKAKGAQLRLITCTGDFNAASGHYRDNLIVFARVLDD